MSKHSVPIDGERIRRLREARGWTQNELAAASGIALRTVQTVEARGASATGYAATRRALERALLAAVNLSRLQTPAFAELRGRAEEVSRLTQAWSDPAVSLVTLVGRGGEGKTSIVRGWLAGMAGDGYAGAARVFGWSFFRRSGPACADDFLHQALRWFGDPDPTVGDAPSRGSRLGDLVAGRRTLLVLDEVESLQHPPGDGREGGIADGGILALLRHLASANPANGLCILTSRLPVRDISAYRRTAAPVLEVAPLAPHDGAALLADLGVWGPPGVLEAVSRSHDGHPATIETLGSCLRREHRGDARAADRAGLAAVPSREVLGEYERWCSRTWSAGREGALLRILALFCDARADPDAVAELLAGPAIPGLTDPFTGGAGGVAWNAAVSNLRAARLLHPAPADGPDALSAHSSIRQAAEADFRDRFPEAWRAANGRLYEHYRDRVDPSADDFERAARAYRAVEHGCESGRFRDVAQEVIWDRICRGPAGYKAHQFGVTGADLRAVRRFFPDPRSGSPSPEAAASFEGADRSALARLNYWAGFSLHALGEPDEAILRQRSACRLFGEAGDEVGLGFAAGYLSRHYLSAGRVREAIGQSRECISHATHFRGDPRTGAVFLRLARELFADSLYESGDLTGAADAYREAGTGNGVPAELEPGYRGIVALHELRYADFLASVGRTELARWALGRLPRTPLTEVLKDLVLGRLALLAGSLEEAGRLLEGAIVGIDSFHVSDYHVRTQLALAEFYRRVRRPDAALGLLADALERATRYGLRLREADCHRGIAEVCNEIPGRSSEGAAHRSESRRIASECGYGRGLEELAESDRRSDRPASAGL